MSEMAQQATHDQVLFSDHRMHTKGRANWLVDGKAYMAEVADIIERAEHEIFITGWQLNHHIYLKRPTSGQSHDEWEKWRLGNLLKEKASKGVRVYILLFEEPNVLGLYRPIELGNQFTVEELHDPPNGIHVYCHRPDGMMQIYSHHEKLVVVDYKFAFIGGLDLAYGRWDTPEHKLNDNPTDQSIQLWKGKDYKNTFLMDKDLSADDYKKPDEDFMDRSVHQRMPWHDVGCLVEGPAVHDLARHFIQRYNHETGAEHLPAIPVEEDWDHLPDLNCRVVRSYWNKQVEKEASIQDEYCALIAKAEESIYIENQFFISSLETGINQLGPISYGTIENTIVKSLADRIIRAHRKKKSFKVIIVIPLKPEMPGKWQDSDLLRSVAYLNYATISRKEDSLFKRLEKAGIANVSDYVSIFGLRTHDTLNGRPVTEIIYVHTKLMIVDDKCTIIGSANINDRSMVGDRDSELAVVVDDKKFSQGLRRQLTEEHLGLGIGDTAISTNFETCYMEFIRRADANTEIYLRVFGREIELTNDVRSLDDLKERMALNPCLAETTPSAALTQLEVVRGHVVNQPLHFLEEDLGVSGRFRVPGAHPIIAAIPITIFDERKPPLPGSSTCSCS